jgi:hypothetical protein
MKARIWILTIVLVSVLWQATASAEEAGVTRLNGTPASFRYLRGIEVSAGRGIRLGLNVPVMLPPPGNLLQGEMAPGAMAKPRPKLTLSFAL